MSTNVLTQQNNQSLIGYLVFLEDLKETLSKTDSYVKYANSLIEADILRLKKSIKKFKSKMSKIDVWYMLAPYLKRTFEALLLINNKDFINRFINECESNFNSNYFREYYDNFKREVNILQNKGIEEKEETNKLQ